MHQPFRALRHLTIKPSSSNNGRKPKPQQAEDTAPPAADPEVLFRAAVADVQPLPEHARERVDKPPPASPRREVTDPDAEALAELCDLVSGAVPFDISDSDEYLEGAVVGIDPRLVRRLRAGEFAYQAHLDLHGMNSEQARAAIDRFLSEAYQSGKRCVLIVHGRGHNSLDRVPVLKRRVVSWLTRGRWARIVLAFTSARSCDGGAGALYLLLRRDRTRRPFRVTEGAKR
jgi:DNA-nicking Smr family endonuclease